MASYVRNVHVGVWLVLIGLTAAMCVVIPMSFAGIDDTDGDGVRDSADNCIEHANANQTDTDADGFGDACDPDYNNDGAVGISDFNEFRAQFGLREGDPGFDPGKDHDGNGGVGVSDFNLVRGFFGQEPGPSAAIGPPVLFLDRPRHGEFVRPSSDCDVPVQGSVPNVADIDLELLINELAEPTADGFFATSLLAPPVFVPVLAEATRLPTGESIRQQNVAHCGNSIRARNLARRSVGVRLNDSGIDEIEPVVNEAIGGQLPAIEAELFALSPIQVKDCIFLDIYDLCLIELDRIIIRTVDIEGVSVGLDSITNALEVAGSAANLDLTYTAVLDGAPLGNCDGRITATRFDIAARLGLEPASDRTMVDVNQIGDPRVTAVGLQNDFINFNVCNFPILEQIIDAFVGDIGDRIIPEIEAALEDPDGNGPQDSLVAQQVEDALAGVSIAGLVGSALNLDLTALFSAIPEDNVGVTFEVDANVETTDPDPTAPSLPASYAIEDVFPGFGARAPNGVPYDVALALSQNLLNKLLRTETEAGGFRMEILEFDYDTVAPEFGLGVRPINTLFLAFALPAFLTVPAEDAALRFTPTLAPVLTMGSSSARTSAVVDIAGMDVTLTGLTSGTTFLTARLAGQFELTPELVGGALRFAITGINFVDLEFISSPIGLTPEDVEQLDPVLGDLNESAVCEVLESVDLPSFQGFSLSPVELEQDAGFLNLYTNLVSEAR
ncbi:MAG: thrombospondin type 3 repeat-containing protein [Myxococcota bacterium]|nr:thrombospondin type 3 repeat-containing protein [Myxococcota bacterium]